MFGTLESWILYRLRRGTDQNRFVEHISDISSCTATGFFDPFTLTWASWALKLFSLKVGIVFKVLLEGSKLSDFYEQINSIFRLKCYRKSWITRITLVSWTNQFSAMQFRLVAL